MKLKRTFKKHLEANKKLVLVLMFVVIVLGIIRIIYLRNQPNEVKTEDLEESAFIEMKQSVFNNNGVGIMDLFSIYSQINELDESDSLGVKKMNDKLDKIIKK